MKLITSILGCALAVGLMTFAANTTEAGVVIGNTLYSPLKLKVAVGYYDDKGVIKKTTITSKEVLKMLGYTGKTELAINTGSYENNEIFIINKDSILENLTAQGILTADVTELLDSSTEGDNGKFQYKSSGVLSLYFYSNPQFYNSESIAPLIVNNPDLDQAASQEASDYWFEISGLYAYKQTGSAYSSGKQNISTSLRNIGNMSGTGYDADLNAPYPTTVKGSASANGDGKILVGG